MVAVSSEMMESAVRTGYSREMVFAGDGVRLAGQIDYPTTPKPQSGFPLLFVLHHAGWNTRSSYQHFANIALASGFAVFRWDQRGAGRSGAGGRGSTTQDAVLAYETALDQPDVNHRRVVIMAHGAGTGLLGSSYGLFARVQRPHAAILVGNLLDHDAVLALDTTVRIVVGQNDWNPWKHYGKMASEAHNATYSHGAAYYVVRDCELNACNSRPENFDDKAATIIKDWLRSLCPPLRSI